MTRSSNLNTAGSTGVFRGRNQSGTSNRRSLNLILIIAVLAAMLAANFRPVFAMTDGDGTPIYEPTTNNVTGWPEKQPIYGQSCVLMDLETGAVLCSLERETTRYPASTTKVMTCLLALENLDLNSTVTMTEEGVALATEGSSNCGSVVGEEFTVEQCLYMLMLKSANDIATQLAIEISGSVEAFADLMNRRAEEIGCTGTHFHNPSGMPDEEHYTTAVDLARIFREAYKNEMFRKLIGTAVYTVPPTNKYDSERTYQNHNSLIIADSEYYYEYCKGGKTGFTNAAQRTLVSAAEKDGRTLICVTMKTPDKSDYIDQKRLYTYGFDYFTRTELTGGAVILPNDLDASPFAKLTENVMNGSGPYEDGLYSVVTTEDGDRIRIKYVYSDLPVGSGVVDAPKEESVVESVLEIPADAAAAAGGGGRDGSGSIGRGGSLLVVLILILAAVAVGALIFAGLQYKKKLDREREALRRRREQRRREKETEDEDI